MLQINRYLRALSLGALLLLGGACQNSSEELLLPLTPESGLMEVRVAAPAAITRTELEDNGVVTRWSPGDKIALWATDGTAMPLSAQTFTLWHFGLEFPTAYFTSVINPMAAGEYSYYGAYPLPVSVSGTQATFDLPAVQDGTASALKHALMVARPTQAGPLSNISGEDLHLNFVHKAHILKITIPETKNLLGEPLQRIELTFPVEVVGRLTTDVSDVESPVALSQGSRVLTLNFTTPVNAGDVVYAVVAPVDASSGLISFRGYSERRESESIATSGKNFLPGHVTPIRLTIPQMRKITYFYFSVGDNYLGEKPNSFTVTVNGGAFPDGSSSKSFTVNDANLHEYVYEGDFTDNFSGKTLTYTFDSNSAVVSSTTTAPTIQPFVRNASISADVPYLFEEDFSRVDASVDHNKDGDDSVASSDMAEEGESLDAYMPYSLGWSAARYRIKGGACVRINVRYQQVSRLFKTMHHGCLTTPSFGKLKSGASVKLKVEFDAGAHVAPGVSMDHSGQDVTSINLATNTGTGVLNGQSIGTSESGSLDNFGTTHLSQTLPDNYEIDSFGAQFPTYSQTISAATNATRLCFYANSTMSGGILSSANEECFIYIDNIKVSIVQ